MKAQLRHFYQRRTRSVIILLLSLFLDISTLLLALWLAYHIRFNTAWIPAPKGVPTLDIYFRGLTFMLVLFLLSFYFVGLYREKRNFRFLDEFIMILKGFGLSIIMLMAIGFLYRGESYSRLVMLIFGILACIFISSGRLLIRALEKFWYKTGYGLRYVALLGLSPVCYYIMDYLENNQGLGYKILGVITSEDNEQIVEMGATKRAKLEDPTIEKPIQLQNEKTNQTPFKKPEKLNILGKSENLEEIIEKKAIDTLIVTLPMMAQPFMLSLWEQCDGLNVEFKFVPDFYAMKVSRIRLNDLGGIPLLSLKESPLEGWQGLAKSTLDKILVLIGGILISPLLIFLIVLVKLSSPGPIFYKQERIGLDGRSFMMYKFRSMRIGAEKNTGPVWATQTDTRTTFIGAFMRKTSLDELPQLWNILKGDMSLVGPRPERPFFVEQFEEYIPRYLERHKVKSGITGWAQINGLRGNTSIIERTKYDLYYIENWSLWLDIKILFLTFFKGFIGKNAY